MATSRWCAFLLLCVGVVVCVPKRGVLQGEIPENITVTEEVFFEFKISNYYKTGEPYIGKIIIAVFGDIAPLTALNFISLAKGYNKNGKTLTYKNTVVHRVVPDFVIQMGDVTGNTGLSGTSIYGDSFNDEEFILSHSATGMVAMANTGPDTNGSQFFITLRKARWLDGHHVVFGKVVKGLDVIKTLGEVPRNVDTRRPVKEIKIVNCGITSITSKYILDKEHLDSEVDIQD